MVFVKAGFFIMGRTGVTADQGPHKKVFMDDFYIDRYEVSNEDYKNFLDATGRQHPMYWDDPDRNAPKLPIVGVDWADADSYCRWANKRLPSEAEWEKAARGEEGWFFPWGNRFEVSRDILMEPSFMFKTTEKFIAQVDVNLKMYFGENYWAGVSYRTGGSYSFVEESLNGKGSAAVIMGGIRVDKYYFGYSFDYTFNAIGARTMGSHEIMAAVKFGDNARRYRWLNRY